jgi:DNA-binding transcriptional regulator GbsR (MarR family)
MFVKVKDSNFVRDTKTMGLSNRDFTAKEEYYNKVNLMKKQKNEINNLKNDVSEIKSLLIQLLDKERNGQSNTSS